MSEEKQYGAAQYGDKYRGCIAVTGGMFNPYHSEGHGRLLKEIKKLVGPEGKLIVVVANDKQILLKNSAEFMTEDERLNVIRDNKYVDFAILAGEEDVKTMGKTMEMIRPDIFCKGGEYDEKVGNLPGIELDVCAKYGIEILYRLAPTANSSSEIKNRLFKRND